MGEFGLGYTFGLKCKLPLNSHIDVIILDVNNYNANNVSETVKATASERHRKLKNIHIHRFLF